MLTVSMSISCFCYRFYGRILIITPSQCARAIEEPHGSKAPAARYVPGASAGCNYGRPSAPSVVLSAKRLRKRSRGHQGTFGGRRVQDGLAPTPIAFASRRCDNTNSVYCGRTGFPNATRAKPPDVRRPTTSWHTHGFIESAGRKPQQLTLTTVPERSVDILYQPQCITIVRPRMSKSSVDLLLLAVLAFLLGAFLALPAAAQDTSDQQCRALDKTRFLKNAGRPVHVDWRKRYDAERQQALLRA